MIKFTKDCYPDISLYEKRLNVDGYIIIDTDKIRSIRDFIECNISTLYELTLRIMSANSGNKYSSLDKQTMYDYLVYHEGVPEYRIGKTPNGDISMDMNKYLKPLLEDGFAEEFLSTYVKMKYLSKVTSDVTSILQSSYEKIDPSKPNLKKCRFHVGQKDNLRFFYRDNNIIGISELYSEVICPPPGYVLVTGDFAQSDFRIAYNLFLRDEENAKIMDNIEDKYEGMARIQDKAFGTEFNLEDFKKDRKLFKVTILGPIYGKVYSNSMKSKKYVDRMNSFLEHCPNYQKFKSDIANRIDLGLPLVIESYFGNSKAIPILNGSRGRKDAINNALNSPIQTGTSEIMILMVNHLLDTYYSMGYTEDDIRLYYTRHDEPIFIMKEELMKDSWVFKNHSRIIVDSWTPLDIEFSFQRNYKVPNEELQKQYELSIENNKDKIDIIEQDKVFTEYKPIKSTDLITYYFDNVGSKTVICVYNDSEKKAMYRLIDTESLEKTVNYARDLVLSTSQELFRKDTTGAIVRNKYIKKDIYYGGILYKFDIATSCNEMVTAKILCENMCLRLAKRDGYEYTPTMNIQDYKSVILGVKDWNE